MFYAIQGKKKVPINYNTTYAQCPGCSKFHKVDLQGRLQDIEGADLCDTNVFCDQCTRIRAKRHRGEAWAETVLEDD